jgi:acetyltransferase EpsM
MTEPFAVLIPLVNPNEAEALLSALYILEGQLLQKGDLIAELETTKSNAELLAEQSGYVRGLRATQGDTLRAGERLCYLAANLEDPLPVESAPEPSVHIQTIVNGLRISGPARQLAIELNVDLARFPSGTFITSELVREAAGQITEMYAPNALIVYGGGGHGKSLIELIRYAEEYKVIGVVDDGLPVGSDILGVPVLGGGEILPRLRRDGLQLAVNAVGGIGNLAPRLKVFERLEQYGFICPTVIHPTALIEASAELSAGVQVMPFAYIGSSSQIGFGSIINTRATVSHDCQLGEYVNLAPGAILAGGVQVGPRTLIGMNATVNLEVKIGSGVRIGNGATVKSDIGDHEVVRAGTIWPIKS